MDKRYDCPICKEYKNNEPNMICFECNEKLEKCIHAKKSIELGKDIVILSALSNSDFKYLPETMEKTARFLPHMGTIVGAGATLNMLKSLEKGISKKRRKK